MILNFCFFLIVTASSMAFWLIKIDEIMHNITVIWNLEWTDSYKEFDLMCKCYKPLLIALIR